MGAHLYCSLCKGTGHSRNECDMDPQAASMAEQHEHVSVPPNPDKAIKMLRSIEWNGYDVSAGERACPNCGAWKYQHKRKLRGEKPIHVYGCSLAVLIDAPQEEPNKEIYWSS